MPCPHAQNCSLFPQFTLRNMRRFWGAKYCEADYQSCERWRRGEEGEQVAPTLLPNGKLLEQVE